jgi:hypothetical protein
VRSCKVEALKEEIIIVIRDSMKDDILKHMEEQEIGFFRCVIPTSIHAAIRGVRACDGEWNRIGYRSAATATCNRGFSRFPIKKKASNLTRLILRMIGRLAMEKFPG